MIDNLLISMKTIQLTIFEGIFWALFIAILVFGISTLIEYWKHDHS